ncbi:MAG: DNA polymerase Y family protein [Solirubrobacteraceae bacterium]
MIVCVYLPRFELLVAAGGPEALAGAPLAIAPSAGGKGVVGQVSGAAEALGVRAGMVLGEALARCPALKLVAGDPVMVARAWERTARDLEGIGAQVELGDPGLAYFDADGLRGLHGGLNGVLAAARVAVGRPARVGVAPTRFCALAVALQARSRRPRVIETRDARRYLAGRPIDALAFRPRVAALVGPLERLGIATLGQLVGLGAHAVADRFGEPGTLARRLALGHDTPLETRRLEDRLEETLTLGESNSGQMLERGLEVLVDRLLARPQRRGRTIRALVLFARLVDSGTWSERVVLREATADRVRIRLALSLRLTLLPAPAEKLGLAVERFGPSGGEQATLLDSDRSERLARLGEAVRQTRTLAGPNAALRVLCVDPKSRVPDRWFVYTPRV